MAKLFFVFTLVAFGVFSIDGAPPGLVSSLTHVLTGLDINALLDTCKTRPGGCNSQSEKAKRNRAAVKESMTRDLGEGHMKGMTEQEAEKLLLGTQSIKQALNVVNKLTGILASDNGLLGGDRVLKSQSEIDTILGRVKGLLPSLDIDLSNPTGIIPAAGDLLGRKKRADALSLDYYRGNRWPNNQINVFIDPKIFTPTEANIIRDALKSITAKVSCLTFVESKADPKIEFVKTPSDTDSGTCGWSSVGYQKGQRNDVNLNFDSSICRKTMKGVIVHEFLHALGFSHEHTRNDRDNNMKIDWKNVDPQSVDVFDKDDPSDYNPYGKPYDELSIMHYDVYVGAANPSKPAMIPLKHPDWLSKIGNGETMTDTDAGLLKRLYCTSSNCRDSGPNCGWRALNGECSKISSACPKSCGICDKTG